MKTVKFISKVVMVMMVLCIGLSSCNKDLLNESDQASFARQEWSATSSSGNFVIQFYTEGECAFIHPGEYADVKDYYTYQVEGSKILFFPASEFYKDNDPLYGLIKGNSIEIYNSYTDIHECTLTQNK